jgi:class 3 adenylate cyclase
MAAEALRKTSRENERVDREVWPRVEGITARCAALFIDIRGSSAMSAELRLDSAKIARRTEYFLLSVRELLTAGGADEPSMVKSFGDGLLCVWELGNTKYASAKRTLLRAVLHLNKHLGRRLTELWEMSYDVKIGIGLAAGDAAQAKLDGASDYFGYTVNLASKLQAFARPSGVVVDSKYLSGQDWHRNFALQAREFVVAMIGKRQSTYYVTPNVFRHHDWTCLSWPGLAINGTTPPLPRGLNTLGISVVTHEGIHGKIGTLEMWPRNDPRDEHGDPFELIIDDFDALSTMSAENSIQLEAKAPKGSQLLLRHISEQLLVDAEDEKFLFVPVRCGLNALAWNNRYDLSNLSRYSEVLGSVSPTFQIAIYDNSGATLPVLIRCLPDERLKKFKSVFEADSRDFELLYKVLGEHQTRLQTERRDAKLFTLYQKIDPLALALQSGRRVHAVLGGGAWLANPKRMPTMTVTAAIPKDDYGFLWIEGCALLTGAHDELDHILQFIEQEILSTNYQLSMIGARPYGSIPVTAHAIGKILSEASAIEKLPNGKGSRGKRRSQSARNLLLRSFPDARPTMREASTLFKSPHELQSKIEIRRKPLHLPAWREAWENIRSQFCELT